MTSPSHSPRSLGDHLHVLPLGLGCMGMSEFYGASDDRDATRLIHEALERGVSLFDSADTYGQGHNEQLLGKALHGRRDSAVIATKFGIVRRPGDYARSINTRPEYVLAACEASLARLGIDTIDLYYAHRLDPEVPIEETVGAMSELVTQGKVRALGLCEVSPATLERAAAVHPIAAVQSEYSLWSRGVEDSVLPACQRLGVSLVAYSPLGRGFLSGQIRRRADISETDFRRHAPRFSAPNLARNIALLDRLDGLAQQRGATPAQVALAWLLAQDDAIIPIPGTRKLNRLDENLGALSLSLSDADLASLNDWFHREAVAGERYTEEGMKGVEVETRQPG
ncbi:aldo/keto reductase [Halomonas sp. DP8Y7-1]|uniref:aldo/keto reductase n=1 Tax=Halomonas sp. DP8Y7-1 TaxID=2859078 RepID=UPI001C95E9C8|nr:aldo/keto reductase [Halomonas sp. DP8Y7-1]MBY6031297.1 aldo/keto reductase [Halomonas sp. DP8Y7-1]